MTGNRIRDSKRNPFFQVKVKDGKYSTENQVSYYGKKLPDDTFSFDISNQKVQANLDEFGTIRHITFFHGNYLMESKPGVWVAKDFVQEHQLSISVKWNGQTEKLCEHTKYVETDLAENLSTLQALFSVGRSHDSCHSTDYSKRRTAELSSL